jgi:hypothetical protein
MIKKSTTYAVTGNDNIVIAKGNKKDMTLLRKKLIPASRYTIWNAPASKIGDKLK